MFDLQTNQGQNDTILIHAKRPKQQTECDQPVVVEQSAGGLFNQEEQVMPVMDLIQQKAVNQSDLDDINPSLGLDLNTIALSPAADMTFDSANGFMSIQSSETAAIRTDSLNKDNFYNLLVKLQVNNQLELNHDSTLTSQFYISSDELNRLLEPNITQPEMITTPRPSDGPLLVPFNDSEPSFVQEPIPSYFNNARTPECQELCCLLKFNPLDEAQFF